MIIHLKQSRPSLQSSFTLAAYQNPLDLVENQLIVDRLIELYALSTINEPSFKLASSDNLRLKLGMLKIHARFSKKKLKRVAKVTVDKNRRRSYLRNVIRGQFG